MYTRLSAIHIYYYYYVRTSVCRSVRVCVMMTVKTACDRLLSLFMLVAATVRDLLPSHIRLSMSCQHTHAHMQRCSVSHRLYTEHLYIN